MSQQLEKSIRMMSWVEIKEELQKRNLYVKNMSFVKMKAVLKDAIKPREVTDEKVQTIPTKETMTTESTSTNGTAEATPKTEQVAKGRKPQPNKELTAEEQVTVKEILDAKSKKVDKIKELYAMEIPPHQIAELLSTKVGWVRNMIRLKIKKA